MSESDSEYSRSFEGRVPGEPGHLESLIGTVGAVLWEFDWSAGAFTYVSPAAERLLGYPVEAWLEPGFWVAHLHPDDAQWAPAYCMLSTRDRTDHEFEYRMIHADGHTVWLKDIVTVDPEKGLAGNLRGVLVGITAQKVAEEHLVSAERHFRTIMNSVGLLAVELDADGVITFANDAAERALSSPPGLIGTSLFDLVPPDRHDVAVEMFENFILSGGSSTEPIELSLVDSAGNRHQLRSNYSTLRGPDGEIVGIASVSEDVTKTATFKREIARKAEEFDAIFELTRDLYFRVDAQGRLTDYRVPEDVTPYAAPEGILGRQWTEVLPPSVAMLLSRGVAAAHEIGAMVSAEYELPGEDGYEEREARFLPLEGGDTAVITRDITARKRAERELRASEERYKAILDSTPFGMRFYRIEGDRMVFQNANPAADAIIGIDHAEREGLSFEKAFPALSELDPYPQFRDIALDGGTLGPFEVEFEQDGSVRVFEVTAFQIRPGEVATVFVDSTERRAAAARERQYQRRLSALAAELTLAEDTERRRLAEELHDRVSQTLAAAMMHLRTAQFTGGGCESDELGLTRELLEASIAETRTITTELFPPVLHELGLSEAIRWLCEETERVHGLPCVSESLGDFRNLGEQTETVLFRGARELLVNVAKHADASRASVVLSLEHDMIELSVEDDGHGFDPLDAASAGSAGFGLFSIRERLPHLGGELIIDSTPGDGVRATMRMPLTRRD